MSYNTYKTHKWLWNLIFDIHGENEVKGNINKCIIQIKTQLSTMTLGLSNNL